MNNSNETTRILSAETQDQLIKSRDAELARILKLRFVLAQVGRMRATDLDLPDPEQVLWEQKMLSIRSYLRLNDEDCLLNLEHCRSVPISYIERKAVRKYLIERLQVVSKPIADFGQKMRSDFPELFADTHSVAIKNSSLACVGQDSVTSYTAQLRDLEQQRRENLVKLVELHNCKCAYMKAAAELKMGPCQTHELELLFAQSNMNQVKASLLCGFQVNEMVNRSHHSIKAIKQIEQIVNEALEQTEN